MNFGAKAGRTFLKRHAKNLRDPRFLISNKHSMTGNLGQ
jgi:hypothetical protein